MNNAIKECFLILFLILAIAICVLCYSIHLILTTTGRDAYFACFALTMMIFVSRAAIWYLCLLVQGKTILITSRRVIRDGGEIFIAEPSCNYRLLIFSNTPFTYTHGYITISNNTGSVNETIVVNSYSTWFYPVKGNKAPMISNIHLGDRSGTGQFCIKFFLARTNTTDELSFPSDGVFEITVWVKKMKGAKPDDAMPFPKNGSL